MASPLSIEFTLTESEFVRAHRAHLRRSLLTIKNLILLTVALCFGALQGQLFGGADTVFWVFFTVWLLVIGFAFYSYLRLPVRFYRKEARYARSQRVLIENEDLTWDFAPGTSESSRSLILKRQITNAWMTDGFLLLYVSGAALPWVIPRRALGDDKAWDSFLARLSPPKE